MSDINSWDQDSKLAVNGYWSLAAGSWFSVTGHTLLASSQQREASSRNPKA
ncbi:MAG: hypothetical protein PVJ41_01440 [Desulfobacterales bacterium]